MKTLVLIMFNETRKRLLIIWDYKFNIIMQFLTVMFIFIGASFFIGGGKFNSSQLPFMLLGYLVWFYARIVILNTGTDITTEAAAGTLEQMYMSPVPTEVLLLGRLCAMLVTTIMILLIPALILSWILHITIPLRWEAIPVLLLTIIGLFGFTLVLTGAALVFKQIDALADLVQNLLLFLTGSLVPISSFPGWLAAIAKALPITQGIVVLRSVVINGQSLTSAWQQGGLLLLLLHSILYCAAGWLIFKWCERIAKQQGSLGQY